MASDQELIRHLVSAMRQQAGLLPPKAGVLLPSDAELTAHIKKNLPGIKALLLQGLQGAMGKAPAPKSGAGALPQRSPAANNKTETLAANEETEIPAAGASGEPGGTENKENVPGHTTSPNPIADLLRHALNPVTEGGSDATGDTRAGSSSPETSQAAPQSLDAEGKPGETEKASTPVEGTEVGISNDSTPQSPGPAGSTTEVEGKFTKASVFLSEATDKPLPDDGGSLPADEDAEFLTHQDIDGRLAKAIDEAVRYAQAHVDEFDPKTLEVRRELLADAHRREDIYGQFSMRYGQAAQELNRYLRREFTRFNDVQWEGPHLPPEGILDEERLVPWVTSGYLDARLNRMLRENPQRYFHICLLIDASGSMTEKSKSHHQQAAGFVMLESLGGLPNVYVSILKAKDNARGLREVSRLESMKVLARQRMRKNAILDFMKPDGCGNADIESLDWALGVEKDWQKFTKGKGESFYFPVTDGQGEGWNPANLRQLHLRIEKLKRLRASVTGIGIGEHMDTTEVYGDHLKLSSVNDLPAAILGVVKNKISRKLRA